MAFELEQSELVDVGLKRIVREQLDAAIEELEKADERSSDEAVHSARKRFKRIRAVVRLIRKQIGPAMFAAQNACFRDAGGSLSQARDAHVLVETLDSLKDQVDPEAFAAARKLLLARRRTVKTRVIDHGNALAQVVQTAKEARERVETWPIADQGWKALKAGLKRSYGDGRDGFKQAVPGAPAEHYHEWRKRVKDLWHQLEIVEAAWEPILKPLAEQVHQLADLLGDDHDLAVLRGVLAAEALAKAQAPSVVIEAINAKCETLQTQARLLGAKIYAEKTASFVARLGAYFKAWKRPQVPTIMPEPAVHLADVTAQDAPPEPANNPPDSDVQQNISMPAA
jgi:CHAD domain-containing protein